jgi:bis(5'-nucleosyl)-tetraphosphatase (symmetrical)
MSTYVIGDVQGCLSDLLEMMEVVDFKPERDRIWLTGDLVNRGEDSAGVLRWCMQHNAQVSVVLGNHDLHLLAVAEGFVPPHHKDTLSEILTAPDREPMLHWLRQQPVLHREGANVMVHAGLLPGWSVELAEALADELNAALRGPDWRVFLRAMYGNEPRHWDARLHGQERLRLIANAFTRTRYLHADGGMEFKQKGPLANAPQGLTPWFDFPQRASRGARIFFGHWSALGLLLRDDVVALDTGCLWGGGLTAFCLEDGQVFRVSCQARHDTHDG